MIDLTPKPEKALLVGVGLKKDQERNSSASLEELALLAETAGFAVVGLTHQWLDRINPATFIGSGKVEELADLVIKTGAQRVVFDIKLSGVQQRNLQEVIKCKVLDRHQLIIEIFAQRARTREGKLQVELALLKDQLPRLIGEAIAGLSRLAGGIGTRGPGESKLEMDRRRIKVRIEQVTKSLEGVRNTRELHRKAREASRTPVVALAGYTNAGKSSLLNALTGSAVTARDQLFETLDPTARKLQLPSGRQVILTDTVGFINDLPMDLIEAFKATFEEIELSDLILHVHDASHGRAEIQSDTVMKLLKEIGAGETPIIHVYNKSDQTPPQTTRPLQRLAPSVNVSALTGEGLDRLLALIDSELEEINTTLHLTLPIDKHDLAFELSKDGKILGQESGEHVVHYKVSLPQHKLEKWTKFK